VSEPHDPSTPDGAPPAPAPVPADHRHLRSALEFVVALSAEGQKRRPPLPIPAALKPHLQRPRLPTSSLGAVRRIVEGDDAFRNRLAVGAVPELVDPIGLLWLQRPPGWQEQVEQLVAQSEAARDAADAAAALHREQKRRESAEHAAARTRAELVELHDRVASSTAELQDRRADVAKLRDELTEARAELVDARNELRHARDRMAAAVQRAERADGERAEAVARSAAAEGVRDEVLADRAAIAADAAELASAAALARDLAAQLSALARQGDDRAVGAGAPAAERARRRPLALPGGVVNDSDAATAFLVRSGASVLVDGYNVAKLGWPDRELALQRRALLDATENLARRHGADLTVVFDGADVVGAHTDERRLVRVVWSPEGVLADDVIRAEVARLPVGRPVVVVTNDAAVVADVRQAGANVVSSNRFLALARR
jgi:predicted RNA-binding protein with PIN domain